MSELGSFGERLVSGPLLVGSAAIGTRLVGRGLCLDDDDPVLWNLSHPEAVFDLHRRDVDVGANTILTNTFGASRPWLDRFGRGREAGVIAARAVALAREAAGPARFLIGSIGPGASLGKGGAYQETASWLCEAGVDALVLETHRFEQAVAGLRALHGRVSLPILVSLYAWPDLVAIAARRLFDLGAGAVGTNCGSGPGSVVEASEFLAAGGLHPRIAIPSAGVPDKDIASPSEFAGIAARLFAIGVRMVGGCCGTTEAHVAAIREAADSAMSKSSIRPERA